MGFGDSRHRRKFAAIGGIAAVVLVGAGALIVHGRADSAPQPAPPPALAASAVPYLPSHTNVVTSDELIKDATISQLPSELSTLGFINGSERTFQGPTRHRLTLVQSRTLRFRTAAGAAGYVAFVRDHAGDYVGQIPGVKPFASAGRRGVLIKPPLCACHLAEPALLGIVSSGPRVTWLEINGPGTTLKQLQSLMALAP